MLANLVSLSQNTYNSIHFYEVIQKIMDLLRKMKSFPYSVRLFSSLEKAKSYKTVLYRNPLIVGRVGRFGNTYV